MMDIAVRLVLITWETAKGGGRRIADDKLYELTAGNFHGGTTLRGTIALSKNDARELVEARGRGYVPVVAVDCEIGEVGE